MEAGFISAFVVGIIIGIAIGVFIGKMIASRPSRTHGILNVDCSDLEDGPYLFLELNVPINEVVSQKQTIFDVNVTKYISHE